MLIQAVYLHLGPSAAFPCLCTSMSLSQHGSAWALRVAEGNLTVGSDLGKATQFLLTLGKITCDYNIGLIPWEPHLIWALLDHSRIFPHSSVNQGMLFKVR